MSSHPIAAIGEEIIRGLGPIICSIVGHKWEESEKHINWRYGDGGGEMLYDIERHRKCINCKKHEVYRNWRWWLLLNPWVDYSSEKKC